jgi:hypothetical protein
MVFICSVLFRQVHHSFQGSDRSSAGTPDILTKVYPGFSAPQANARIAPRLIHARIIPNRFQLISLPPDIIVMQYEVTIGGVLDNWIYWLLTGRN